MYSRTTKKAGRTSLLFFLAALFVMILALPALAENQATVTNSTVYCGADYTLTATPAQALITGDTLTANFPQGTDLSELTEISLDAVVLANTSYSINHTNQTISITLSKDLPTTSAFTLKFKGIINTSIAGDYDFYLSHGTTVTTIIASAPVIITAPKLTFSAEKATMQIYERNKLTISLLDSNNNPWRTPIDSYPILRSNHELAELYEAAADVNPIYQTFPVPGTSQWNLLSEAGDSSWDLYYRPLEKGIHTLDLNSTYFGSFKVEFNVTVADAVKYGIDLVINDGLGNRIPINQAVPMQVNFFQTDQYYNDIPTTEPVTFNLIDDSNDGISSATFLAADQDGNCTDQPCTSVTIPAGESSALFYFKDSRISSEEHYSSIKLINEHITEWFYMNVVPGPSAKIILEPTYGQTNLVAGLPAAMDVYLEDAYGNRTGEQPETLTVNLSSTSATGYFYESPYAAMEERISQVSFPGGSDNEKMFIDLELQAEYDNSYLVSESWDVPANREIDSVDVEYNCEYGYDYVYLQGWDGEDWYTVWSGTGSGSYEVGVPGYYTKIRLALETDGSEVLNPTYVYISYVYLTVDQSVQTVYYMDPKTGTAELSAAASGLNTGKTSVTTLTAPARLVLETENNSWPVKHRGKVTFKLQKEDGSDYIVPTALENGITVWLRATIPGTWWDAMINGNQLNASTVPVLAVVGGGGGQTWSPPVKVSIPAGAGSIDLWFSPEQAGDYEILAIASDFFYANNNILHAEKTLTASRLDPVNVVYNQSRFEGTAGQPIPVSIILRDQYENPVEAAADVTLDIFSLIRYQNGDGMSERQPGTGHFYLKLKTDGTPDGDEVHQITIPKGSSATSFYYYDQVATSWNETEMGMSSMEYDLSLVPVYISPGQPTAIKAEIIDYSGYETPVFSLSDGNPFPMFTDGNCGVIHDLLIGRTYSLKLSVVDKFGNVGAQTAKMTVDLPAVASPVYGKFYTYPDPQYINRISQVELQPYEYEHYVWFGASGAGDGTITAKSAGLTSGTFSITTRDQSALKFYFPEYRNEYGEIIWRSGDGEPQSGSRIPVIIHLTDAVGNRLSSNSKDVAVTLTGNCFYQTWDSGSPVTTVTIPKGCSGIQLFVQAPDSGTSISLTAASTGLTSASAQLTLRDDPIWTMGLNRGWNALSIPLALDKASLTDIVEDTNMIGGVYTWNGSKWLQIYQGTDKNWYVNDGDAATTDQLCDLVPMSALYIKMSGQSAARFWKLPGNSGPYSRTLNAGWNLVGPSIDLFADKIFYEFNNEIHRNDAMYANELLSSIKGKYSQVVSPGLANQPAWSYVPKDFEYYDSPLMEAGKVYWIYLTEKGELAGFSYTTGNR